MDYDALKSERDTLAGIARELLRMTEDGTLSDENSFHIQVEKIRQMARKVDRSAAFIDGLRVGFGSAKGDGQK